MTVLNRTQVMLFLSGPMDMALVFLNLLEVHGLNNTHTAIWPQKLLPNLFWLDSREILSKLSLRDREMWNLTKATCTERESFLSSEVSGEKFISSGLAC